MAPAAAEIEAVRSFRVDSIENGRVRAAAATACETQKTKRCPILFGYDRPCIFRSFPIDCCARPRETRSGGVGTLVARKYNFLISLPLGRERTEVSLGVPNVAGAGSVPDRQVRNTHGALHKARKSCLSRP